MLDKIEGFAYILGDDINTDDIVPSHTLTMRDIHEMVKCTLEFIDPNFAKNIDQGNIIIAGENFGTGSSREEAVNVFKILGIKAIIVEALFSQEEAIQYHYLKKKRLLRTNNPRKSYYPI